MQLELLGFPPGVLGLTLQQEGGGYYDKKTTRQLGLEQDCSEGVQEELHQSHRGTNWIVDVHQIL